MSERVLVFVAAAWAVTGVINLVVDLRLARLAARQAAHLRALEDELQAARS